MTVRPNDPHSAEALAPRPLSLIAVTAFGLEAVVARELESLGVGPTRTEDGRVWFSGDAASVVRANLWLRSAERVLLCVGRFPADDFGGLFDGVRALPWEQWLGPDAKFPVSGRSARSKLYSVPDCQRLTKKAIAERLMDAHGLSWCEETGPEFAVEVSLLRDEAVLTLDTSGAGLHKRGYRRQGGDAPLRETVAAGLVQLSYWSPGRLLLDPFCGSGTILIEAAMLGRGIPPGLKRGFAAEQWPAFSEPLWRAEREAARAAIRPALSPRLIGGDIDPRVLDLARAHARTAGVAEDLTFRTQDAREFHAPGDFGCLITNPPYGERLGEQADVERLYRDFGRHCRDLPTWSLYVLTTHPEFERLFGRRADRRRKLYNAKLACTYYQFQGPRPPRTGDPAAPAAAGAAVKDAPAADAAAAAAASGDPLADASVADDPSHGQAACAADPAPSESPAAE